MSDRLIAPKLCRHKPSDRAYSKWRGKRYYFGKWGSPEAQQAYEEFITDLKRLHDDSGKWTTSVARLAVEFLKHSETFYRRADGSLTTEHGLFQQVLRILVRRFGNEPASAFGPKKLKVIQDELAERYVRTVANRHLGRIKLVFGWGVANELVPAEVADALKYVQGLKAGRSRARESDPVEPVPVEVINQTLPHLPPILREAVKLQLKTGARPGEIINLRMCEIDRSGEIWMYRPSEHKNAFRGKKRVIPIGPVGQAILSRASVGKDDSEFVFAPETRDGKQQDAGKPYTMAAYRRAITRACEQAFEMPAELTNRAINRAVKGLDEPQRSKQKAKLQEQAAAWRDRHTWTPNQLRHTAATEIAKQKGLDAARTVLGHSEKSTTEIYAERDWSIAAAIAAEMG